MGTIAPTKITLARMFLSPVFLVMFYMGAKDVKEGGYEASNPYYLTGALVILLFQEASDLIDGFIARRLGKVTEIGKLLDPLADTLSHFGVFLCLLWIGLIPIWVLIGMYYREAIVWTLRIILAKRGIVMGARLSGKAKAVCQGFTANAVVFSMVMYHVWTVFPMREIAQILGIVTLLATLFSLVDYILHFRKLICVN